jgi:methyl-accepting chemotaxis protein
VLAMLLPRSVARQLRRVIGSLGAAAGQMHGVVSQVATTALETASSISEAATTVDEVRQTSLQASQKATRVADDAQRAEEVAETGRLAVGETLAGMERIEHEMVVVSESIVRMNEQSQSVAEILDTISGFAEQSQLLSVNAALEASSAGQFGKGFGVVAEEIKNLAAGSKGSVVQVRGIMNDVQSATAAAVMAAEQSSRAIDSGARQAHESSAAIDALAGSVGEAAQGASQIVAATQQQLVGMDQLGEAMSSIDEASAHNAQGARELENSVRQVEQMAFDLQEMVATTNPLAAIRRPE